MKLSGHSIAGRQPAGYFAAFSVAEDPGSEPSPDKVFTHWRSNGGTVTDPSLSNYGSLPAFLRSFTRLSSLGPRIRPRVRGFVLGSVPTFYRRIRPKRSRLRPKRSRICPKRSRIRPPPQPPPRRSRIRPLRSRICPKRILAQGRGRGFSGRIILEPTDVFRHVSPDIRAAQRLSFLHTEGSKNASLLGATPFSGGYGLRSELWAPHELFSLFENFGTMWYGASTGPKRFSP